MMYQLIANTAHTLATNCLKCIYTVYLAGPIRPSTEESAWAAQQSSSGVCEAAGGHAVGSWEVSKVLVDMLLGRGLMVWVCVIVVIVVLLVVLWLLLKHCSPSCCGVALIWGLLLLLLLLLLMWAGARPLLDSVLVYWRVDWDHLVVLRRSSGAGVGCLHVERGWWRWRRTMLVLLLPSAATWLLVSHSSFCKHTSIHTYRLGHTSHLVAHVTFLSGQYRH